MGIDDHQPCWPDPTPACCDAWDDADPALKTRVGRVAASILHKLSGARYGLCRITVRPCSRDCNPGRGPAFGPPFTPMINASGAWINCWSGGCGCESSCSCCSVCKTTLVGPVQEIIEVRVDGELVPPASYWVDNYRELVRVDGVCWPTCPDLEVPLDLLGGGAFGVTYTHGIPLDEAAQWAYSAYACELLKACVGSSGCRLPKRVQSVTREGVTMSFIDTMDYLDKGRTGLPDVDQWLSSVNPYGLRQRSRVLSSDYRPPRRTTWP
ncbi:hypothetical protein [Streptosporangium amethystogenes]|uniref:hypothetical protein n=1 Tax=Streptosporangium amethystogenes TaxID=2002 RepID=UPI001B80DD41|nr:hypothetical protein [Streptosporangium amethystogenes]